MIIAISGKAGSGKSTIAKKLAKKLGFKHYSMGDIQRQIAKEKGISIVELGELEKTNPEIDLMIDERQKSLGKLKENFVIDSWLSAFFIPHAYKIFLDADLNVRAERLAKREESYKNKQEAAKAIKKREKDNKERFIRLYGFDYEDKSKYDIVIDTTNKSIDEIISIISKGLKYIKN